MQQKVEKVAVYCNWDPLFSALGARMQRQQEWMSRMHFWQINCRDLKDATNLLNLFQKCSAPVTLDSIWDNAVRCLRVGDGIGEEGWTVVASLIKFLNNHGEEGRYHNLYASRSAMLQGRREDLKIGVGFWTIGVSMSQLALLRVPCFINVTRWKGPLDGK